MFPLIWVALGTVAGAGAAGWWQGQQCQKKLDDQRNELTKPSPVLSGGLYSPDQDAVLGSLSGSESQATTDASFQLFASEPEVPPPGSSVAGAPPPTRVSSGGGTSVIKKGTLSSVVPKAVTQALSSLSGSSSGQLRQIKQIKPMRRMASRRDDLEIQYYRSRASTMALGDMWSGVLALHDWCARRGILLVLDFGLRGIRSENAFIDSVFYETPEDMDMLEAGLALRIHPMCLEYLMPTVGSNDKRKLQLDSEGRLNGWCPRSGSFIPVPLFDSPTMPCGVVAQAGVDGRAICMAQGDSDRVLYAVSIDRPGHVSLRGPNQADRLYVSELFPV